MQATSELLSRNEAYFENQNVLLCGFIADDYFKQIAKLANQTIVWLTDFTQYKTCAQLINKDIGSNVSLNSIVHNEELGITLYFGIDINYLLDYLKNNNSHTNELNKSQRSIPSVESLTLGVLYITKTKAENLFYLEAMHYALDNNKFILSVGGNDEGIRGVETLMKKLSPTNKVDNARKCLLLASNTSKELQTDLSPKFDKTSNDSNSYYSWKYYDLEVPNINPNNANDKLHLKIAYNEGVFCAGKLDIGTDFLLQNLNSQDLNKCKKVLDLGCGSGVISSVIAASYPQITVYASDINAYAIAATIETSRVNNISINTLCSDMLTNIVDKYDTIITNPPFHAGIKKLLTPTLNMLSQAPKHLSYIGSMYIVANSFLPYYEPLSSSFRQVKILADNKKFSVYKAII